MMERKVIHTIVFVLFALLTPLFAQSKLEVPVSKDVSKEIIFKRTAYTLSFNTETNLPNWVAWKLNKERLVERVSRKGYRFNPDPDIDVNEAVVTQDYANSGYDRGHMYPAGDSRWSGQAMMESFYMTNICPQHPNLNGGDWHELEKACRRWALEGTIYIVCGPILYKNPSYAPIGKEHKIRVPEAFFKVILAGVEEGRPRAIGFIYKNTAGNRPLDSYVNSIDQVERITGMDFFPALPDDIEQRIEKDCNVEEWR